MIIRNTLKDSTLPLFPSVGRTVSSFWNRITAALIFHLSIILISFIISPVSVKAGEASIVDLVVANSKTDLLAFFNIDEAFNSDLIEGVKHGIPVTFIFEVGLDMTRNGWLDKSIVSGSFEHTLTYDSLKKMYTVRQTEMGEEVYLTDDFNKAQRLMSEANGIKIVSLKKLVPDRHYTLRVKATLEKTTLPLKFHYLIPFTEFWDLKTDWTKVEFIY